MNVKAGDVISVRKPSHLVSHSAQWFGKRVIAVELDVIRMEELGFPPDTYFQVPKGHIFILGDNRGRKAMMNVEY
ncbi:hypothetical protein FJTKL_11707 [Diaporthe vaccinii]|uniref:Mitochondrial inner membrane protease subunit n=1 Tax=Diaporthe vaccinii TaxID=105482 RepID=A0ABR4EFP6_9PEZI